MRRLLAVLLFLSGTLVLIGDVYGRWSPVFFDWRMGQKNTCYAYVADGVLRLTWFRCDAPLCLSQAVGQPTLGVSVPEQGPPSHLAMPSTDYRKISVNSCDGLCHYVIIPHGTLLALTQQSKSWLRARFEFRWITPWGTAPFPCPPLRRSFVRFPGWVALTVLWLYPGLWLFRRRVRPWYRRRRGLCGKCGYDLRGNESGVCSECGTRVESR
jgi:hypothetical protein